MKEDALLIAEVRNGNSEAYGEIVRKYQARLFNTLHHVMGNREEAEDIGQDAFVQAFVKLDTYQGKSAFYTWLYRIAFNLSVSYRRRKKNEASIDQMRETSGTEPVSEVAEPDEGLLRDEQVQQVRAALDELAAEHRAILVLRELEGCCYDTIADILELAPGTVRSRLHRARLQLKEKLHQMLHEQPAE